MEKSFLKRAFTLAETLIVIGIIGVVAALTLPNLNHATGDKEKVTKVKKIYSSITEAFDRAEAVYGPMDEWCKQTRDLASCSAKRILEFMKVSKDCGFDEGCYPSGRTLLSVDGSSYNMESGIRDADMACEMDEDNCNNSNNGSSNTPSGVFDGKYQVVLPDGTVLAFQTAGLGINLAFIEIFVDIDGANKGKSQFGNDVFKFLIDSPNDGVSRILTTGTNMTTTWSGNLSEWLNSSDAFNFSSGWGLAAWVIENGNLDYLKCPDELNWETQTSCK